MPLKPDEVIKRAKDALRRGGAGSSKAQFDESDPESEGEGASKRHMGRILQMCRIMAVHKAHLEDISCKIMNAATSLEHAEQSYYLRQGLFAAAFHCSRDHPQYRKPVFLRLSAERCACVLATLVFTVPSLLFGPRCVSLADYYGADDKVRAALKPVDTDDNDKFLLQTALHGELYRFLQKRFLAIYGVQVPNGTHIDTSIYVSSVFFVCSLFCLHDYTRILYNVHTVHTVCILVYT